MSSVPVPIRTIVVRDWLGLRLGEPVGIETGGRTPLTGGVASRSVQRVEVTAIRPDGERVAYPMVAKRATEVEALALGIVAELPDVRTFPDLVDAGADEDGPWVLLPYYAGRPLAWNDPMPPAVLADLARLHVHGRDRLDGLSASVPRMGADFIREALLDFASGGLRRAAEREHDPTAFTAARHRLRQWAEDGLLTSAASMLDVSLLHGDVYGPNALRLDDPTTVPDGRTAGSAGRTESTGSRYRLIDWGNLRVGPVLFDALMAVDDTDSAAFTTYLRTWQEETGQPFDPFRLRLGVEWAGAFVNAAFCGTVAERFGRQRGQAMFDRAERSYARLRGLVPTS